jgi:hypothetical protein
MSSVYVGRLTQTMQVFGVLGPGKGRRGFRLPVVAPPVDGKTELNFRYLFLKFDVRR